MKPVGEKILVEAHPVEKVSKGGIIIVADDKEDKYQDQVQEATILAMGPLAFKEEVEEGKEHPKVGDSVMIARYAGYPLKKKNGVQYRVISDVDITLVLGEEDE